MTTKQATKRTGGPVRKALKARAEPWLPTIGCKVAHKFSTNGPAVVEEVLPNRHLKVRFIKSGRLYELSSRNMTQVARHISAADRKLLVEAAKKHRAFPKEKPAAAKAAKGWAVCLLRKGQFNPRITASGLTRHEATRRIAGYADRFAIKIASVEEA